MANGEVIHVERSKTVVEQKAPSVASLIRADLKAAYPGVKFSVRTKTTGSIRIDWEMGPSEPAVEALLGKYVAGHFDGMTDSYVYDRSNTGPTVRFIFTSRDLGSVKEQIQRDLCKAFGVEFGPSVRIGTQFVDDMAYRAVRNADLSSGYHGVRCVDGAMEAF